MECSWFRNGQKTGSDPSGLTNSILRLYLRYLGSRVFLSSARFDIMGYQPRAINDEYGKLEDYPNSRRHVRETERKQVQSD